MEEKCFVSGGRHDGSRKPGAVCPGQGEGARVALAGVSTPWKATSSWAEGTPAADTPAPLRPWGQAALKALCCPNLAVSPNKTWFCKPDVAQQALPQVWWKPRSVLGALHTSFRKPMKSNSQGPQALWERRPRKFKSEMPAKYIQ